MKILKYIFFLVLLSMVASTIFIATQKGEFTFEKSKIINSPKPAVFSYVNDAKNWSDWNSWALDDSEIKISFSPNTVGKGSSFSWNGKNRNGDLQTLYVIENDSIVQKMNYEGNSCAVFWSFKDTLGGTKVSWKAKGKMDLSHKIQAFLNGGTKNSIEPMFEISLNNIDKKLDFEINSFSVNVNGLVNKPDFFYLAQHFTSKFSSVIKNTEIVLTKIADFCKKNNIVVNGKPFVIYHTFDTINEQTKLSICIPIKDSIFLAEGSDISASKMKAFQAVKSTLKGDYSHKKVALKATYDYFTKNHLVADTEFSHLEIYSVGKNEFKNQSKWITEIYFPIKKKAIVKPRILSTSAPINSAPAVVEPKKEVQTEL